MNVAAFGPHSWTSFDTLIVVVINTIALAAFLWWKTRQQQRALHDRLTQLDKMLARVEDEWRFQHRQATYVGTLRGLWIVLKIGLDQGGLTNELRASIYRAGDEMFAAFDAETSHHDGHDGSGQQIQLWDEGHDRS